MVEICRHSIRLLDGALDLPVSLDHDRCVGPSDTVRAVARYFPDLGITRLGEITRLETIGIPVAFAVRPNSFTLSINLGKGVDRDSALASAAMEAAETALAERMPAKILRASINALEHQGEAAVDLSRIARCHPHRLRGSAEIEWIAGLDLVTGTRVLVPWALVGFDHRPANEHYHDAFEVTSDGLASGNTMAEAVLHGICELIERDAYGLLELLPQSEVARRSRDPLSVENARARELVHAIARAGLKTVLLDMTSDISVPAYAALLVPGSDADRGGPGPAYLGCGCHPSSDRAVIRALTEAAQAQLAFVAGARDDLEARHYDLIPGFGSALHWAAVRPDRNHTEARSNPPNRDNTIGEAIDNIVSKLLDAGIPQVLIIDLSPPDREIAVARVIIPDLQVPLHGTRTQVCGRGLRQLLRAAS